MYYYYQTNTNHYLKIRKEGRKTYRVIGQGTLQDMKRGKSNPAPIEYTRIDYSKLLTANQ